MYYGEWVFHLLQYRHTEIVYEFSFQVPIGLGGGDPGVAPRFLPGSFALRRNPYQPDSSGLPEAEGAWEEVLQKDPAYPDNVYLTELIEFHPGKVGDARRVYTPDYYDPDGLPSAIGGPGPPRGFLSRDIQQFRSDNDRPGQRRLGVWRFDPDYRIVDREGADFITFANHNVLGGDPDGSWNELGRVYVSADGTEWYENGAVHFTVHPDSGTANSGYDWDAVRGLHGNTHAWANFRKEIRAEEIDPATGLYIDAVGTDGSTATVSRYFTPDDPYLGGTASIWRILFSSVVIPRSNGIRKI